MRSVYCRETRQLQQGKQYGEKYLCFLYKNICGRLLLKIIVSPIFSKINGVYNNSFLSKRKIPKFIKKYNINMEEYEKKEYTSFNDFFIRKRINPNVNTTRTSFISPADSKLLVYNINKNLIINVKNTNYSLKELINEEYHFDDYIGGNCLVFRLSMEDYHRYCFVDNGSIKKSKYIKGKLHTVSSMSSKDRVYVQNCRQWSVLQTENFEEIICIEVGALLVGKIHNKKVKTYIKGEEKGYFKLGGSTIIILTKNNIRLDTDIQENSKKGIETMVKYGERIGELR